MTIKLLSSPHRSDTFPGRLERLEGVLGRSREGCVTVGGAVVVWPAEIELRSAPHFELLDTDAGAVVAREGDLVAVGGGFAPMPSSDAADHLEPREAFWAHGPIQHLTERSYL